MTALREHMAAGTLVRAMAAHSPLSALLVEEAGFEAVWASGFELSALYGLPDASLVGMAEHLAMVRAMSARVALPIVADIDTGYGNAVNVVHAVREYARAGAAAVVIEDKHFPKATSLRDGGRHPLVDTDEFSGKIEAALYARRDRGFLVIARTEALIAGLSVEAAVTRARAYADAGADMVLVHSKQRTPAEIEAFVAAWDRPTPIVVVPTTYPQLTETRARRLGRIGMIIYGNHAIRASVQGMRAAFGEIARAGAALPAAESIASVEEIFALQDTARLDEEERRFVR